MDAELKTLLQNMKSLVNQAEQMVGSAGTPPEGEVEESEENVSEGMVNKIMKFLQKKDGDMEDEGEEEEGEEGDEGTEVEKATQESVSSEDEGVTATDSASNIIDEKTEVQEKNLNEIARAIAGMMINKSKTKVVKKSRDKEILTAMRAIVDEQNTLRKSVENILSGLGVADKIKALETVEKSKESRKPQNDSQEIQKSLEYIKTQLGIQSGDNRPTGPSAQSETVHKSIASALEGLVQR